MRRISLAQLTRMFGWIGISSIGGGRSAYIYEVLVERHAWLTRQEFLPGYTMSQLLPGPTISNLSIFLGNSFRGIPGAVIALLAVLVPGSATIIGLAALYFMRGSSPSIEALLEGMGAAVVGFLCILVARMGKGALRARGALPICLLTLAAVGPMRLNALAAILVVGGLSLWLNRPGRQAMQVPPGGTA
ncbi:MAG TPA: chromate transporter [Candidatus Baltobacteraceae bacterium]|nr:chromate transporter [Candidatus Baltobacteraceae bacterium]